MLLPWPLRGRHRHELIIMRSSVEARDLVGTGTASSLPGREGPSKGSAQLLLPPELSPLFFRKPAPKLSLAVDEQLKQPKAKLHISLWRDEGGHSGQGRSWVVCIRLSAGFPGAMGKADKLTLTTAPWGGEQQFQGQVLVQVSTNLQTGRWWRGTINPEIPKCKT